MRGAAAHLNDSSVRLDEAEHGDVLFGVALHQVDEQRPQRGVLEVADVLLQLLQLVQVSVLAIDQFVGQIADRWDR